MIAGENGGLTLVEDRVLSPQRVLNHACATNKTRRIPLRCSKTSAKTVPPRLSAGWAAAERSTTQRLNDSTKGALQQETIVLRFTQHKPLGRGFHRRGCYCLVFLCLQFAQVAIQANRPSLNPAGWFLATGIQKTEAARPNPFDSRQHNKNQFASRPRDSVKLNRLGRPAKNKPCREADLKTRQQRK